MSRSRDEVPTVYVYDRDMNLVAELECPFEYDDLCESLQYNGYTTQVERNGVVLETTIAK